MWKLVALLTLVLSGNFATTAGDLTCAMPLAFVDRWADTNGNSRYDDGEAYDPLLTGFQAPADVGLRLTLTAANPTTPVTSDTYYLVALPPLGHGTTPLTGEAWLRKWVSDCAPYGVSSGDSLAIEPGTLFFALLEELNKVVAEDSAAYWDDATQSVKGSAYESSPRLLAVPSFDPRYPPTSGSNFVVVSKIAVLFLESTSGPHTINARFVDSALATVPTEGATWGGIKSEYRDQE